MRVRSPHLPLPAVRAQSSVRWAFEGVLHVACFATSRTQNEALHLQGITSLLQPLVLQNKALIRWSCKANLQGYPIAGHSPMTCLESVWTSMS